MFVDKWVNKELYMYYYNNLVLNYLPRHHMTQLILSFHLNKMVACLGEYKMLYTAFQLVLHQFHHRIQFIP